MPVRIIIKTMPAKNDLNNLPTDENVSEALKKIRARVEKFGIQVVDNFSDSDHARFVGIFENRTITLYPNLAPPFALWFTVAHLFGHMTQMSVENPRVARANELVLRVKHTLAADDVQLIYDHEREAAEIGRALIADVEDDLPFAMDIAYNRFFHADFRYLINFIETGEQGVEVFARHWRREPIPRDLIRPDSRELLEISEIPNSTKRIVVV